jgi:hypothetical protein
MTAQVTFSYAAACDTDAETVMRVLDDVDRWPTWARPLLLQAGWERWGDGEVGGPGAIRKLGAWPMWIRELILTREPNGHTYTVISPASFSHYLGTVNIVDRSTGGVEIEWRVEFTARRAVLTPVVRTVLMKTISGLLTRLVVVAQRETRAAQADWNREWPT